MPRGTLRGPAGACEPQARAGMAGWDTSVSELEDRVRGLVRLLDGCSFLAQCHVTDFYTEGLWETLPADWRAAFEALAIVDALHFISLSKEPSAQLEFLRSKGPVPHSLEQFLSQLALLPLPRSHHVHDVTRSATPANAREQEGAWCGFKVGEGLTRGMSPKKMHEVEELASFVSTTVGGSARGKHCSSDSRAERDVVLVDIGSGQGYLSRVLAVKHNFKVVAVESDEQNVRRAREIDDRVAVEIAFRGGLRRKGGNGPLSGDAAASFPARSSRMHTKRAEEFEEAASGEEGGAVKRVSLGEGGVGVVEGRGDGWVRHVVHRIRWAQGGVLPLLDGVWRDGGAGHWELDGPSVPAFGLVCLHACGDLVPSMLMAFAGDARYCRYLFAVSCCYMKVSCTGAPLGPPDGDDAPSGSGDDIVPYPMSGFLQGLAAEGSEVPLHLPDSPLGYHFREQACHAIG
jgi:hypothetical protein